MNKDDFRQRIDRLSARQRKLLAAQIGASKNRSDNHYGRRIIAYVVGETNISGAGLRKSLKEQLPDYMVPAAFVILKEMPRLPNGKIDLFAMPAPNETTAVPESSYEAPQIPIEKQLAAIWEEVLNFKPVGIHDNFFEIGGDSILSIQIVAKARKAGLLLGANQLFEHQTIAELALFIQPEKEQTSKEKVFNGPLPLTPIQHWFFEEHRTAPHHWNQAIIFTLAPTASAAKVNQAVQELILHHDALRLTFTSIGGNWEAAILEPEKINSFQHVDLSGSSLPEQDRLIQEKSSILHSGFKLSEGSLFQGVYFTCEPAQRDRVLFVAHHLLVDSVSWQILTEDFNTAFAQLSRGEKVHLGARKNGYKAWSEFLTATARAGKFREESGFWQAQTQETQSWPGDSGIKLPVLEESIDTIKFGLDVDTTHALLKEAGTAYRMRPDEILIAAFLKAFERWTGENALTLGLERHGRENMGADIDPSNTVGWFTAYFPLTFQIPSQADPGSIMKSVKEQLRQIPNGGIGYGILRYLDERKSGGKYLDCRPPIIFNYLGIQNTRTSDPLDNAQMEFAGTRDPKSERFSVLEINAFVQDGRLQVWCDYSRNMYNADTVERLISNFAKVLREFIDHGAKVEDGGYTPSDFPEAGLNQEDLDELLNQFDKKQDGNV